MKLSRKDQAVVKSLEYCSGSEVFARDLTSVVSEICSVSISPKGVGKRMVYLEDLGFVDRIQFTASDALYNRCRYAYKWIPEELR